MMREEARARGLVSRRRSLKSSAAAGPDRRFGDMIEIPLNFVRVTRIET
jgi:hypothetical protein